MDKLHGYKYSQLKSMRVIDSEGDDIGRIIDFTFTYEKDEIIIQHFILGDSRIVEFLERIGLRKDIDPVVPWSAVSAVERGSKTVKLNVPSSELKRTVIDPDAIPDDVMLMSNFSDKQIISSNGEKCGRPIDVIFDETYGCGIVLGGSWLEEVLEDLRLISDVDFILPDEAITEIEERQVTISLSKEDLDTTITSKYAEAYQDYDERAKTLDDDKSRRLPQHQEIRLI